MNDQAQPEPENILDKKAVQTCHGTRDWIALGFSMLEDVVYVGLGVLLGVSAIGLLIYGVVGLVHEVGKGSFPSAAIELLDEILLILLIVEVLYTVQVSFRTHTLQPEPFLLIGLIAAIRRVLVLTAKVSHAPEFTDEMFRHFFLELAILTMLILAVAISLVLVRGVKKGK